MTTQPGIIIVNADDFGMSSQVNRAIVTCFEKGLISSTTLMANMPGFEEACELAIQHRLTDRIGIHLNLTEGMPLVPELRRNAALCDRAGEFRRFRSRHLSTTDRTQIAAEFAAQIERCRQAGLQLTHADAHQHVHTEPMVFLALRPVLKQFGIRYLRISRNMDSLPALSAKRLAKTCFNRCIAACGLRRTDYFGTVANFEDFRKAGRLNKSSFEILTHPSLDQHGTVIDHLDNEPLVDRLENVFRDLPLVSYSGSTPLASSSSHSSSSGQSTAHVPKSAMC